MTEAFRADQFDLFPSPIGKLLNAPGAETKGSGNGAVVSVPHPFIAVDLLVYHHLPGTRLWPTNQAEARERIGICGSRWVNVGPTIFSVAWLKPHPQLKTHPNARLWSWNHFRIDAASNKAVSETDPGNENVPKNMKFLEGFSIIRRSSFTIAKRCETFDRKCQNLDWSGPLNNDGAGELQSLYGPQVVTILYYWAMMQTPSFYPRVI